MSKVFEYSNIEKIRQVVPVLLKIDQHRRFLIAENSEGILPRNRSVRIVTSAKC